MTECKDCIHFEVCAYASHQIPICDSYAEKERHGRWEWSKNGWICDNCDGLNNRFTKFCPNCGATMDGCDGNSDMA